MRSWWAGLDSRERRTLVLGGLLLGGLLIYAGLWAPLADTREHLLKRRAARLEDLAWMQRAGAEVRALRGAAEPGADAGGRSLLARLDTSAKAAGIAERIAGIQPETGARVQISVEDVGFDALMRWLGWLHRHGIEVDTAALQRVERSPNVNGRLVLAERGA